MKNVSSGLPHFTRQYMYSFTLGQIDVGKTAIIHVLSVPHHHMLRIPEYWSQNGVAMCLQDRCGKPNRLRQLESAHTQPRA